MASRILSLNSTGSNSATLAATPEDGPAGSSVARSLPARLFRVPSMSSGPRSACCTWRDAVDWHPLEVRSLAVNTHCRHSPPHQTFGDNSTSAYWTPPPPSFRQQLYREERSPKRHLGGGGIGVKEDVYPNNAPKIQVHLGSGLKKLLFP